MQSYQREFIEFALNNQALLFGEFKLNSGRISPYFFNAGCFDTGAAMAGLGRFYAQAIQNAGVEYDLLFGPAYKGISLVTATAIGLFEAFSVSKPYCFNRKEPKDHGEGGSMVGAPLCGRVLIIDDVISTGLTLHKVIDMIQDAGAEVAGIAVALDRQEKVNGDNSALQEVKEKYPGISVTCIVELQHVILYLQQQGRVLEVERMEEYRTIYGAS